MNKDFMKWIGLGFTVVAVSTAAATFSNKLNKVEKTGLTLGSTLALLVAGYVLLNRIEDAADQAKRLI